MTRESISDFYADRDDRASSRRLAPVRLLSNAAYIYRLRVREQPLQEALAVIGIAAGVALLFAMQVASSSIAGSLHQLSDGITGRSSIEIAARGTAGIEQSTFSEVEKLASVKGAAPLVQRRITAVGKQGGASLTLVGVDDRFKTIGGPLVKQFMAKQRDINALGFYLTESAAERIGAAPGDELMVQSGSGAKAVVLAGTLGSGEIGELSQTPVALAPIGTAQRITGMTKKIDRILVEPADGLTARAKDDLQSLVADRSDVRPSDAEVALLEAALRPDRQTNSLFSAIAIVIGLLFAFNAMLLAMTQKRRITGYLRLIGADRATVVAILAFDAIVLGVVASAVGIVAGIGLSRIAFESIPEYLAAGFTIGEQRNIGFSVIGLSLLGGLTAAVLASSKSAIDLLSLNPAESTSNAPSADAHGAWRSRAFSALAGLSLIGIASVAMFAVPQITPVGVAIALFGCMLVVGPIVVAVLSFVRGVLRERGGVSTSLAVEDLVSTPTRATALAIIAASAITATLTVGGARLDLERGVDRFSNDYYATSDAWISAGGQSNVFLTQQFEVRPVLKLLRDQPDVRIAAYYATLLDVDDRRVYLVARPPSDRFPVAPSQVLNGNVESAQKRIRSGGWVTVSNAIATESHLKVGDDVALPTPLGDKKFRVAAITANYGWPSGSIVMNARDYTDLWGTSSASAIALRYSPMLSHDQRERIERRFLDSGLPLQLNSSREMIDQRARALTQSLARIRQISTLILAASTLAIVAAMSAAVWHRRDRLASLRALGLYRGELYRTLFAETTIIVLLGGICGLAFGLFCQYFSSRWTEISSGFLSPYFPAVWFGLRSLGAVLALAALATLGPAFFATRIKPRAHSSG